MRSPARIAVSTRIPAPSGGTNLLTIPGAGRKPRAASSALIRISMACPPRCPPRELEPIPGGDPHLLAHDVESRHGSLTGCSTWSRQFTSMK